MSKVLGWFIGLETVCLVILAVIVGLHITQPVTQVHETTTTTTATNPQEAASLVDKANHLVTGTPSDQSIAWSNYEYAAQLDPVGACRLIAQKCRDWYEQDDFSHAAWISSLVVQYQPDVGLYWLEYGDYQLAIDNIGDALYGYWRARELLEQIGDESEVIVRASDGIDTCLDRLKEWNGPLE